MHLEPGLAIRAVHSVTRVDCMNIIRRENTLRQRYKMRVILHGVFQYCCQQEWCLANPVERVRLPHPVESGIVPLSWAELVRLTSLARTRRYAACMAPLGLMLWAGVRPAEVCRLEWADIDWVESVVVRHPLHSKIGGSRHITMQDVLRHTYASYHARHFHDFNALQESMGHRSASLLRTRYLSMRRLTAGHARRFWQAGEL